MGSLKIENLAAKTAEPSAGKKEHTKVARWVCPMDAYWAARWEKSSVTHWAEQWGNLTAAQTAAMWGGLLAAVMEQRWAALRASLTVVHSAKPLAVRLATNLAARWVWSTAVS